MGVMTLQQFRQEVTEGLQRGTDTAAIPGGNERLDLWIHNAMYEFGYALKFHELEGYEEQTLAADGNSLVKPTDFRTMHENGIEILGVENYEGTLLPETRKQYIRRLRTLGSFNVPGRPMRYHIYGSFLLVRPKADVAYTVGLHYWKRIQRLVEEQEVSIFPDDWDDVILTGALYRGFRHFNEFDRYQNVRNDFLGLVRSRKMAEDLEEFPEGGISPVTWHDREHDETYGSPDTELFGEINDGYRG